MISFGRARLQSLRKNLYEREDVSGYGREDVSGHGFSRAESPIELRALAPEVKRLFLEKLFSHDLFAENILRV